MRPEFGPFVFHELKKIKKTFTFWLMVHSSPAESYVSVRSSFPCTILSSLGTSFHPFLTLCVQPKMPEPAGSQSLAGPHVHQDSLLPSLYGQIMSLIKPAWLRALSSLLPPSRVPADFPALGLSLSLSLFVHSLSWGARHNAAPLPSSQRQLSWQGSQRPGGAGIVCP